MFKDSRVLVCGGSGSWGRELTRQLITKEPKEIIIFSRGEISQVDMERSFDNPLLTFVIGDIRDKSAVERVFLRGIDYVFQLAALKHVPICENYPNEAVETNIQGVQNLIDAAIKYKVKKFVDVSTDKSVDPCNVYGMTKAIGERLTIQANCLTKDTDFICIRGGNVLGTNGSLVPYVINQIKNENKVRLTDRRMTRFFLTLPQAIGLLFYATEIGVGGETYVMNMPSFYISDLINILVGCYGNGLTNIVEIGAREGEKIHEVLVSQHEVSRTFYVNDDYYVIRPQIQIQRTYTKYEKGIEKPLTSADNIKDLFYLEELLKSGGWLNG
jgi:UDP-N-acetylglucosamine 4,6-dehydratase/5-epimerase